MDTKHRLSEATNDEYAKFNCRKRPAVRNRPLQVSREQASTIIQSYLYEN